MNFAWKEGKTANAVEQYMNDSNMRMREFDSTMSKEV